MSAQLLSLKDLANAFYKNKIVDLKEIELSSGKRAPYYMDMRILLAFPDLMADIITRLADHIQATMPNFDKIASVPVGAVPFASQLAGVLGKPSVLVREQPKKYGTKKLIEGKLGIDDRVILVEDVITTGASVLKTIQKLKNRGAEVIAVWSLLNREEGGLENIAYEYKDIPVFSLFTASDIFGQLVKEKQISAYDWERIKFYQESQYKETIKNLRERNNEKQIPEWESNQAQYFASRFSNWLALQPAKPSNLILSLSRPRVLTPSQIISICSKNQVQIPLIHTNFKDINPSELDRWNSLTGGRVIYDSGTVLGWDNNKLLPGLGNFKPVVIDNQGNQHQVVYEVETNHLLISCPADIGSAINSIRANNKTYNNGNRPKFVVVSFNETARQDLINNDIIWSELDKLIIEMTNTNSGCCGIAFKYSDMLNLSSRRDLWKRAPVCLWVDDWNLHPSMLGADSLVVPDYHKSWSEMMSVMDKLRPWQIVMDEDAISSPFKLVDRIEQYSQFFKANQLDKLLTEIRANIYSKESEANNNESLPEVITNCQQAHKMAIKQLETIRQTASKLIIKGHIVNDNNSELTDTRSANGLFQGVYKLCRDQILWGYSIFNDIIKTFRLVNEQRNKKHK